VLHVGDVLTRDVVHTDPDDAQDEETEHGRHQPAWTYLGRLLGRRRRVNSLLLAIAAGLGHGRCSKEVGWFESNSLVYAQKRAIVTGSSSLWYSAHVVHRGAPPIGTAAPLEHVHPVVVTGPWRTAPKGESIDPRDLRIRSVVPRARWVARRSRTARSARARERGRWSRSRWCRGSRSAPNPEPG